MEEKITPYRMQTLMEIAQKAVRVMTQGAWHLTFDEMEIVMGLIWYGIELSKQKNGGEEHVPEDRRSKEDDEGCA